LTQKAVVSAPGLVPEAFDNIGSGLSGNALWVAIANAINNGTSAIRGPSQIIVASAGVGVTAPSAATYTLAGGTDGTTTTVALYVDDLLITSASEVHTLALKSYLESKFEEVTYHSGRKLDYVGMSLDFMSDSGKVRVTMKQNIDAILADATPPPEFTVGNASVTEPATGTTNAAFTITMSKVAAVAITLDYATLDGTAHAGSDFTATSGTCPPMTSVSACEPPR
jgi:hypothetical protein